MNSIELKLYGLMFKCPFEEEINNCPFKLLRLLDVRKRFEIMKMLEFLQKYDLYKIHYQRLLHRENDYFLTYT